MARRPVSRTTQSRSSRATSSTKRSRAGRPKPKKKNNTGLFIGLGVGAFFLLMIIIVAANSGGESSGGQTYSYNMSMSQRKSIYAEYVRKCSTMEKEVKDGLAGMDSDTRKKASSMTYKILRNKKEALKNRIENSYRKKIRELPEGYIAKHVIAYGQKQGW